MRIVFDSNILISALTLPGGQGDRALATVLAGDATLILCKPVLGEVLRILGTKFSRDAEELSRVAVLLGDLAEWVEPRLKVSVLKDDPDNRVLECALAAKVTLIVTGDRAMLDLGSFEGIEITSLRTFLERMSNNRK